MIGALGLWRGLGRAGGRVEAIDHHCERPSMCTCYCCHACRQQLAAEADVQAAKHRGELAAAERQLASIKAELAAAQGEASARNAAAEAAAKQVSRLSMQMSYLISHV